MAKFSEEEVIYDPCQPCGEKKQKRNEEEHWVEIELYYEDTGEPVAGEEYWVKVPDGVDRRGNLDENGFAREEGIENPGNCEIHFPQLEKEVWDNG
jgi:hypothetical protein